MYTFKQIFVFIVILTITAFPRIRAQEKLDELKFEAWSVEYIPYRFLVEEAILAYRGLNQNEIDLIPSVKTTDKIILIRSRLAKATIYQIRYGSGSDYTILSKDQVNWIFGETLRKTLIDKDKYFNIDTKIIFRGENRQLEYIQNLATWTNHDLVISLDRIIVKIPSFQEYALSWRWGNELIGYPYRSMGSMEFGLLNKSFEVGIRTPTLMTFLNGIPVDENKILNGGWGGFGRFNNTFISGEMSFASIPSGNFNDQTYEISGSDNIFLMDFSFLINFSFELPKAIIPFPIGTLVLKPGFYNYRISEFINDSLAANDDSLVTNVANSQSRFSGGYFRFEIISNITENGFPRFEGALQLLTDSSVLAKFVINLNKTWGFQTTYVSSLDQYDWFSDSAIYFGLRMSYNPNRE